jgi:hypothetical protein
MTNKQFHRLIEKDSNLMTGLCKKCGPVELINKGGGVRCKIAVAEQKGTWTRGLGYMSTAERNRIKAEKNHRCEICKNEDALLNRDHDHDSGEARGWLCGSCNRGLGLFKDNPELLRAAALYVEGFRI